MKGKVKEKMWLHNPPTQNKIWKKGKSRQLNFNMLKNVNVNANAISLWYYVTTLVLTATL
jgi:hypothetical protein